MIVTLHCVSINPLIWPGRFFGWFDVDITLLSLLDQSDLHVKETDRVHMCLLSLCIGTAHVYSD